MTESACELLALVVAAYDEREGPLTPDAVADRRGADPAAVAEQFEQFVDCELLVPVADGYRPTVTARELLELDVEDGFLIFDVEDDT